MALDTSIYPCSYGTVIEVHPANNWGIMQVCIEYYGGRFWIKGLSADAPEWIEFNAIPSFYKDYGTLDALASAMSAFRLISSTSETNPDNVPTGYYVKGSGFPSGAPSSSYCILISFIAEYSLQFWVGLTGADKNNMYYRTRVGSGTWSGWVLIAKQ